MFDVLHMRNECEAWTQPKDQATEVDLSTPYVKCISFTMQKSRPKGLNAVKMWNLVSIFMLTYWTQCSKNVKPRLHIYAHLLNSLQ